MADKLWKVHERRACSFFGAVRCPLSGSNSRHTSSDCIHCVLYIENKSRKRHAIISLYRKTEEKAKAEGKIPVLTLFEKGFRSFLVVCKADDFERIIQERENLE